MIIYADELYFESENSGSNLDNESLLLSYKNIIKGKKIILYGAGAIGTALNAACELHGISVEYFVDQKAGEIGQIDGIPVYAVSKLAEANTTDYCVIVCVSSRVVLEYEDDIRQILSKYCPNATHIRYSRWMSYLLMRDICQDQFNRGEGLSLVKCINCGAETRGCDIFERFLYKQQGLTADLMPSRKRKFETYFGYITGKNCTLRCKHCNEMIPYLTERGFAEYDQIVGDCKRLMESCDFMPCLELVGGEPFLYPRLYDLIKDLLKIKNVGYLKIFTNGTVVPSDDLCRLLSHNRIVVNFSNYKSAVTGALLENIFTTQKKFDVFSVNYIISSAKTWLSFTFDPQHKSEEKLIKGFQVCEGKDCHRLYNGILYYCHHQYAGVQLGKFKLHEGEYIDVQELSPEELRKACDAFEEVPYIEACEYCNWPFDAEQVPAAEQLQ